VVGYAIDIDNIEKLIKKYDPKSHGILYKSDNEEELYFSDVLYNLEEENSDLSIHWDDECEEGLMGINVESIPDDKTIGEIKELVKEHEYCKICEFKKDVDVITMEING